MINPVRNSSTGDFPSDFRAMSRKPPRENGGVLNPIPFPEKFLREGMRKFNAIWRHPIKVVFPVLFSPTSRVIGRIGTRCLPAKQRTFSMIKSVRGRPAAGAEAAAAFFTLFFFALTRSPLTIFLLFGLEHPPHPRPRFGRAGKLSALCHNPALNAKSRAISPILAKTGQQI